MRTLIPVKIKVLRGDSTKCSIDGLDITAEFIGTDGKVRGVHGTPPHKPRPESPMAHPYFIYEGEDIYNLVDKVGIGQNYQQDGGFSFGDDEQFTLVALPKPIADAFMVAHPTRVFQMTDIEAKEFFEDKAHVNDQEELIDTEIVQRIKLKQDMGIPLTPQQKKAINPDDPTPGIRKNPNKKWADFKIERKFTV